MLQFSYMMLKIYGKVDLHKMICGKFFFSLWHNDGQGNFTVEEQRAREKFELQAKEKMESIKLVKTPNIIIFYTYHLYHLSNKLILPPIPISFQSNPSNIAFFTPSPRLHRHNSGDFQVKYFKRSEIQTMIIFFIFRFYQVCLATSWSATLPTRGRVSCLFVIIMSSYLCICLFFVFVYLPTKGRVGQFCCRHHCDHHNGHIISMMMIIILGETFLQVTRLLQGYIENEVKLHNCEHESPHHHCEHQSKISSLSFQVDMNPTQNCRSECSGKTKKGFFIILVIIFILFIIVIIFILFIIIIIFIIVIIIIFPIQHEDDSS